MKYIIELSDDEMEKVKNSHKALFIDVYGMMANTLIKGTPFDSVLEDIKVEMRQVTDRELLNYWHKCDKFIEIIDKHIGKEQEHDR